MKKANYLQKNKSKKINATICKKCINNSKTLKNKANNLRESNAVNKNRNIHSSIYIKYKSKLTKHQYNNIY